ncbi:lytic transglycosylase domain-containing protein [Methylobacterium sp. C25]|uniref:lytic transglycosylase domain-containing protein n=1 Tax=Methylobacterium sp. C25 TaxID=2721622 RepID=UPI001F25EF50|nr:lytic transglycosylase domain-containing protein [Methylobacterium sp. C25]MCE4226946.1 lytic transglycosylase domain-containing protein [Methylobacterium sp. C25]
MFSFIPNTRISNTAGVSWRILVGALLIPAFCSVVAAQPHAQASTADRGAIREVLAEQFRDGTTIPLVLKTLHRASQNRPSDGLATDKIEMQRLARDAAMAHALPVDYFLRLIKQESGFNHRAVSRAGAQGVAQFMPATAALRGLKDPFDPVEALPKSAAFLSDLSKQFGNIGLAAAAYNAGSRRVSSWLAGISTLPLETRSYVLAITGRTAEEWAPPGAHLLKTKVHFANSAAAAKQAQTIKLKNWELELLASLTGSKPKVVTDVVQQSVVARRSTKASYRSTAATAELSLCPTCLSQKTY